MRRRRRRGSYGVPSPIDFVVYTSHGSVSVFQVGIGFSVYRSVCFFFKSVRYLFTVFRYFTLRQSATYVRILKFCFLVSLLILTEGPCPRV